MERLGKYRASGATPAIKGSKGHSSRYFGGPGRLAVRSLFRIWSGSRGFNAPQDVNRRNAGDTPHGSVLHT